MQLNKDGYRSLADKPYHSHYLYVESTIDHPVEKVWPHALDIGSWMSAHELHTLTGESGKVGHFESVHPHGVGPEVPLPHYHLYGVAEIVPFRLIALEVFPEKGGSYGVSKPWMSFDSILLTDVGGGRTRIVFSMVDVHIDKHDEAYLERRKNELEQGRALIESYFENLKRLVK